MKYFYGDEYDNGFLIMFNEECPFRVIEEEKNKLFFVDGKLKKTFNDPKIFFQINKYEFLVVLKEENGSFKFKHLRYNIYLKDFVSLFEKECEENADNLIIRDNVVIIYNNGVTTIYNYKENKNFSFEDMEVLDCEDFADNKYLSANIKIGNIERLLMYIDADSLEFGEFYSVLQDRYIKVIENEKLDFKQRLGVTLEKEVYKYVEYIEEYEAEMVSRQVQSAYKRLERKK